MTHIRSLKSEQIATERYKNMKKIQQNNVHFIRIIFVK